jgi:hypothetical protein
MLSNHSRLGLVTIPVVVLLPVGFVAPVAADPPTREDIPFETFTIPGELVPDATCSFMVQVEALTNKEKITTFFDQEGNVRLQLVTGGLKVQLTNLTTGQSVDLNISGPIQTVPQPDGSSIVITQGPTLFPFEPDVAPDLPRLALIHGRAVSEFDAEGNFTLLCVQGRVEDVCAVLTVPYAIERND